MALESILTRTYTHQSDVWSYGNLSDVNAHFTSDPQRQKLCCHGLRLNACVTYKKKNSWFPVLLLRPVSLEKYVFLHK